MSNKAITWAYEQTGLLPGIKFVLVTMADLVNQAHCCTAPLHTIADLVGMNEAGLSYSLDELIAAGHLTAVAPGVYRLAVDSPINTPKGPVS